ncbi:MAG: hypothetical protein OXI24_13580 [Candidatus Poribacteria bacterium]|nr:hypothetical protein [Candidatus Poribacteria bacterium]
MHYEYAVDPIAITSSWKSCRLLAQKFGYDRGRLLSRFPKKWFAVARDQVDQIKDAGDVEKATMIEWLEALRSDCMMPSGRNFDPDLPWLLNAIEQHEAKPFHAILSNEDNCEHEFVSSINEVLYGKDEVLLFKTFTNLAVPRDAESIANALSVLLQTSNNILFIDPYFYLDKVAYREILFKCLEKCRPKSNCKISIHCKKKRGEEESIFQLIGRNKPEILSIIPLGLSIDVYCWDELVGGEDFHDRFLVTDRGGISIQGGFIPKTKSKTTDMNLMSKENVKRKLKWFSWDSEEETFELTEDPTRIYSDGRIVKIRLDGVPHSK